MQRTVEQIGPTFFVWYAQKQVRDWGLGIDQTFFFWNACADYKVLLTVPDYVTKYLCGLVTLSMENEVLAKPKYRNLN